MIYEKYFNDLLRGLGFFFAQMGSLWKWGNRITDHRDFLYALTVEPLWVFILSIHRKARNKKAVGAAIQQTITCATVTPWRNPWLYYTYLKTASPLFSRGLEEKRMLLNVSWRTVCSLRVRLWVIWKNKL